MESAYAVTYADSQYLPNQDGLSDHNFRYVNGAIGANDAEDVNSLLRSADADAVEGVNLGSNDCSLGLDGFNALALAKIVEVPLAHYFVVVGKNLGLLESDACLSVGAYIELQLVEVVALVEECNG